MPTDCIFCKIINKEIPSSIVYESNEVIAFLNINPVTPGHLVVIPKKHSENILDTDDHLLGDIAVAVKKLALPMMQAVGAKSFNVIVNNGAAAGQVIFHAHWHIIPRFDDDGFKHWPHKEYKEGEIDLIAEKIKKSLNA